MPREPLERLLETVSDEELESLRDAILREEGRRRSQYRLIVKEPHPPLVPEKDQDSDSAVTRWAKLLTWLAKDAKIPRADGKRGVSIRVAFSGSRPDGQAVGILLQDALVEAGLLIGRMPEWVDATATEVRAAEESSVQIELWDRPVYDPVWE
ncbi:MAG: hypothetical protein JXQ72_05020 [Anaerolineae bacterium]|nr:hypothetical protein [Anaerolineae bacterium]